MKKLIKIIPGFRTERVWKMAIATIGYIMIFILFLIIMNLENTYTDLSKDHKVQKVGNIFYFVMLIVLPFVFFTNTLNIRKTVPLIRSTKIFKKIIGWTILGVLNFFVFIIGIATIDQFYSAEYHAKALIVREERATKEAEERAAELLAKEKEQKEKEEKQAVELLAKEKEEKQAAELLAKENQQKEKEERQAAELLAKEKEQKEKEEKQAAELLAKEKEQKEKEEKQVAQLLTEEQEKKKIEHEKIKPVDGFTLVEEDGFNLLLPETWSNANSKIKSTMPRSDMHSIDAEWVPVGEIYQFEPVYEFIMTPGIYSELEIIRYDKEISYYEFLTEISSSIYYEDYIEVDILNADFAYERKNLKDSIGEDSRWELIVFKNDVCYILNSSHSVNTNVIVQGFLDIYREDLKKFRSQLDVMYDSFRIVDHNITFDKVVSNKFKVVN